MALSDACGTDGLFRLDARRHWGMSRLKFKRSRHDHCASFTNRGTSDFYGNQTWSAMAKFRVYSSRNARRKQGPDGTAEPLNNRSIMQFLAATSSKKSPTERYRQIGRALRACHSPRLFSCERAWWSNPKGQTR